MGGLVRPSGFERPRWAQRARRSTAMERRFDGKVVVITGAAGGIGRATAVRFAQEGARVVLVDVSTAPLDNAIAAVDEAGGAALAVEADVARWDEVERY